MCLSPQVDLVAGVAITVVAVDAIRHSRSGRTVPLALLPAIFAVHTFTAAFVWWGAQGVVSPAVGEAAAWFFMFVAFALLPIYVPVSILLLEPHGWRRDALLLLAGAGAVAGIDFLIGLVEGQGRAVACDFYIDYQILGSATISGLLYVAATCGAMLLSGYRPLMYWGVLNVVVVLALSAAAKQGLPSLWCFWAAITSLFVAWLMRRLEREHTEGDPWPWQPSPPATAPDPAPVGPAG